MSTKLNRKHIIIIILLIVIGCALAAVFFVSLTPLFFLIKTDDIVIDPSPTIIKSDNVDETILPTVTPTQGIVGWLVPNLEVSFNLYNDPVEVPIIHLFDITNPDTYSYTKDYEKTQKTYHIGTISQGVFSVENNGTINGKSTIDLSGYSLYTAYFDLYDQIYVQFAQSSSDNYTYITYTGCSNCSGFGINGKNQIYAMIDNTLFDKVFNPLNGKVTETNGLYNFMTSKNVTYKYMGYVAVPFNDFTNKVKVDEVDGVGIYSGSNKGSKYLFVRSNDGFVYILNMKADIFEGSSNVPIITLQGQQNSSEFIDHPEGKYCVWGNYLLDINTSTQSVIGTDAMGGKIYGPKNVNDVFFKSQYEIYKQEVSNSFAEPTPVTLNQTQYLNSIPYILWVNQYGIPMVYYNQAVQPEVMCD